MWQPPMEGEDMDEMGSGTEQQPPQQESVVEEEKKMTEDKPEEESGAGQAEPPVDKV